MFSLSHTLYIIIFHFCTLHLTTGRRRNGKWVILIPNESPLSLGRNVFLSTQVCKTSITVPFTEEKVESIHQVCLPQLLYLRTTQQHGLPTPEGTVITFYNEGRNEETMKKRNKLMHFITLNFFFMAASTRSGI